MQSVSASTAPIPLMRGEALPPRTVQVRAPASTANLGAAFDTAGLALQLHDQITVTVRPTGGITVQIEGEGADTLPRDDNHLVVQVMLDRLHQLGFPAPGLHMHCHNRIPQGRGMGSSAAAVVSGVLAAQALVDSCTEQLAPQPDSALGRELLAVAARWEGHADNVAACLFAGLVMVTRDPLREGAWLALPSPVAPQMQVAVYVPQQPVPTHLAREQLPPRVPHSDASVNVGAACLLGPALAGHPDLLLAATQDRLHQQYRAPLMPASTALMDRLRGQGHAAFISGAGPTVGVLGLDLQANLVEDLAGFTRLILPVATQGVTATLL